MVSILRAPTVYEPPRPGSRDSKKILLWRNNPSDKRTIFNVTLRTVDSGKSKLLVVFTRAQLHDSLSLASNLQKFFCAHIGNYARI